mmetsp:Transcript_128369/g.304669  ORF Transcript_128369/g.304669 Transcript_128369/m.304669 type:complete len:202 (+) Transcript_128369:879-1484(+)
MGYLSEPPGPGTGSWAPCCPGKLPSRRGRAADSSPGRCSSGRVTPAPESGPVHPSSCLASPRGFRPPKRFAACSGSYTAARRLLLRSSKDPASVPAPAPRQRPAMPPPAPRHPRSRPGPRDRKRWASPRSGRGRSEKRGRNPKAAEWRFAPRAGTKPPHPGRAERPPSAAASAWPWSRARCPAVAKGAPSPRPPHAARCRC